VNAASAWAATAQAIRDALRKNEQLRGESARG
jgi:hypothetical protein